MVKKNGKRYGHGTVQIRYGTDTVTNSDPLLYKFKSNLKIRRNKLFRINELHTKMAQWLFFPHLKIQKSHRSWGKS